MRFHKQDEEAKGDEKRAFVPTRASHSHHVAQFLPLTAYVGRVSPWITQFCLNSGWFPNLERWYRSTSVAEVLYP